MENMKKWLGIKIEKKELQSNSFDIVVSFTNISNKSVNWKFRNVLNKAEMLSFTLRKSDGSLVESIDIVSGTPQSSVDSDPEFAPGAVQRYTLKCEVLSSGLLKVGDIHFPINFGEDYKISFYYGGIVSNVIAWKPEII